jgi:hypothetical protein
MARQDDIEDLLRQVAPLFLDIAQGAQVAAADLPDTEWGMTNLTRTASLNQVAGVARWRMVADRIVDRRAELPAGLTLATSDDEQNQGRYYLVSVDAAIVLTVKRKPHKDDEQPEALQLQIQGVQALAPVAYNDEVVVYLAVPPFGQEPTFEVTTRGKEPLSYRLIDLIDDRYFDDQDDFGPTVFPFPPKPTLGPNVSSSLDKDKEANDEEEDIPRG